MRVSRPAPPPLALALSRVALGGGRGPGVSLSGCRGSGWRLGEATPRQARQAVCRLASGCARRHAACLAWPRSSRRRRDRSRQPSPEAHGSPAALPSARHASLRRVATPCRYAASLRRVATRPRVWAAGATLPCRRDAPARQAPGVGERGCRAAQTLLGCAESRGLGPVCCETSGCAGHGLARTDTD